MSPHAVLGPIDPQINGLPAASIIKVAAEKPLSEIDDQTLILADLGQKAIDQLKRQAGELMRAPMSHEAAAALADKLTSGRWTHDYPISADEAKELGLNVNTNMPDEILELLALFPQPVRTTQSVEFGPGPLPTKPERIRIMRWQAEIERLQQSHRHRALGSAARHRLHLERLSRPRAPSGIARGAGRGARARRHGGRRRLAPVARTSRGAREAGGVRGGILRQPRRRSISAAASSPISRCSRRLPSATTPSCSTSGSMLR